MRTRLSGKLFILVLIPVLAPVTDTRAFWSAGLNIHQNITSEALGKVEFSFQPGSMRPYPFSNRAITAINKAHSQADSILHAYNAADHFDSEAFAVSYNVLSMRYQQLRAYLMGQGNASNRQQMWLLFGLMLHQVQDFYAHSTWVAAGHTEIVDFGKSLAMNTTPSVIRSPTGIGKVCDYTAVQLLTPIVAVTTGYYNVSLPPGKCEHGSLLNAIKGCAPEEGDVPDGINHDTDCWDGPGFELARSLAVQESEALIKALIEDVYKSLGDPKIAKEGSFCNFVDSNARYVDDCPDCCLL